MVKCIRIGTESLSSVAEVDSSSFQKGLNLPGLILGKMSQGQVSGPGNNVGDVPNPPVTVCNLFFWRLKLDPPGPCYSKYGPWTSRLGLTWPHANPLEPESAFQ